MRNYKLLTFIALCTTLFFCVAAQSDCQSKNKANKQENKSQNMNMENNVNEKVSEPIRGELKIIAEGANSKVEMPFVFIARSPETYAIVKNLIENAPPAAEINFNDSAVILAFAGTKNTGGYSVNIKESAGVISFEIIAPPKDAMVTQVLTTPYAAAIVPVEKESDLSLDVSGGWAKTAENFRVKTGEFESSGGITGRAEKFSAGGAIKLLRSGDYVTLLFDLSGEKTRKLQTTASGTIDSGKIELARVDAGSFIQTPRSPLKISGTIADDKLNLTVESLAPTASESFQLRGKIEAAKIK